MQKREAIRYLENAKELLSKSPIEDNRYADVKYVREACGTAYIAVLMAIDEYLPSKGLTKDKLPKSVDGYREAIRKHLRIHNGKLQEEFEALYDELHIAGYYRGVQGHVGVIKEIFKAAKIFIEKIK